MKNMLTVSALLLSVSGTALAGSGYDSCIKEEKALKAREASECHGLRYILNPSACFATQKALKVYKAGKCSQSGTAEDVDSNAQAVAPPEKKGSSPGSTRKSESAGSAGTTGSAVHVGIADVKKVETDVPQQEPTLEQLKEENASLKAEITRLKAENEQLRKAGR